MRCRERIPGVPIASQEEALSTGKARGTPGSCHHSQSPPYDSVHYRDICFPCTASTFKPRIDSHHGGTWDSPVGKAHGKASWERLVGKPRGKAPDPLIHVKASVKLLLRWEESTRACPLLRRGLTPLGRLQKYPKIQVSSGT